MKIENINNYERNSGIDALRGVAILSVLLLHVNIQIPFSETTIGSLLPKMVYKVLFMSGFYGVCMFFVISGFLITNSIIRKWKVLPDMSVMEFYALRFARIIPLLVILLIILSILHLAAVPGFVINPERTSLNRALIAAITFHVNWLEIQVGYLPASWDILWSLSIEEIFYLFFPIVCIVISKEWNLAILLLVFLFISPFARTFMFSDSELGDRNNFAYIDSMLIGCMGAIVSKRVNIRVSALKAMSLIGWTLFLFIVVFRKTVYDLGLTQIGLNISILSVGTVLILIKMQKQFVFSANKRKKRIVFFRLLGQYSYEIYLTHLFTIIAMVSIFRTLELKGDWIWLLYFCIIVLSALFGKITAMHISNPLNKFVKKIFNLKLKQEE